MLVRTSYHGRFDTSSGLLATLYETRAEATAAIADYINGFYNVHRLHSSIGYVSPIEFELKLSLKSLRDAA